MDARQIAVLVTSIILGPAILGSYVPIYQDQVANKYNYWLGVPKSTQTVFYIFWVFAAIGFVTYIVSILAQPLHKDSEGLFRFGPWVQPSLIAILLASSLLWSVCVLQYFRSSAHSVVGYKVGASISLITTAVCTILLLAGEAETNAPWYRILGLLGFACTVVLIDPVMWNARWILHNK